uniref:Uncharacterized protein n=1 Tax=Anguilla anguilla TaxID=7936 RepID=A0A0E9XZ52_ANGAN
MIKPQYIRFYPYGVSLDLSNVE